MNSISRDVLQNVQMKVRTFFNILRKKFTNLDFPRMCGFSLRNLNFIQVILHIYLCFRYVVNTG